jgi:TfoX/Sxy family transcriptional regulator of competence genes
LKFPKSDEETAELFRSLLPAEKSIAVRPMFGHIAAFVNGKMFAGTFGTQVFVKLSEEDGSLLMKEKGASLFEPMKGRPMKGYVVMPAAWATNKPAARKWVLKSFAWVSATPAKKGKGRRGLRPTISTLPG